MVKPLLAAVSTEASETKDVCNLLKAIEALNLQVTREEFELEFVGMTKHIKVTLKFLGEKGDKHNLQSALGNKQSGNYRYIHQVRTTFSITFDEVLGTPNIQTKTYFLQDVHINDSFDIRKVLSAKKKDLEIIRQTLADGSTAEYMQDSSLGPALLLGDVLTLADECFTDLVDFKVFEDYNLHNRTGLTKWAGCWLWADKMTAKQQDEVNNRMATVMNKSTGFKQYMDGKNWLSLCANFKEVVLPSIVRHRDVAMVRHAHITHI